MNKYFFIYTSQKTGKNMSFDFYAAKKDIEIYKQHFSKNIYEIIYIIPNIIYKLKLTGFYILITDLFTFEFFKIKRNK